VLVSDLAVVDVHVFDRCHEVDAQTGLLADLTHGRLVGEFVAV
jgi:hypothetical protein